jgi:lipopolysaccharide transport protein LptA
MTKLRSNPTFAAKSLLKVKQVIQASIFCSVLLALLLPAVSGAQVNDLDLRRLPWDIFAETMDFDGKTSTYIYTGVQFSQGDISIKADEGRASVGDDDRGSWSFEGNVVIDVNSGHIECQSAELSFDDTVLTNAVVSGAPATFEMRRSGSDDATHAQAGKLLYDVENGVIEFSEQATITESGNQISSNYLVYNILERRINADSAGVEDDRVRIIYTPTNGDTVEDATQEDENQ